jgi:pseudouridine kinase
MSDITCFGAAHVDLIAKAEVPLVQRSSTPGRISHGVGGVAANVARQLARRRVSVTMVSQVGRDRNGDFVRETLEKEGVQTEHVLQSDSEATGCYLAIEEKNGDMALAVSDTHALLDIAPEKLFQAALQNTAARYWFLDTNLTNDMIRDLVAIDGRPAIAIDAVSVSKTPRLKDKLTEFAVIFCNKDEAEALFEQKFDSTHEAGEAMAAHAVLASVITDGPHALSAQTGTNIVSIQVPSVDVSSVTGAGDALIAATLAGLIKGDSLSDAATQGISAAADQLRRSTT